MTTTFLIPGFSPDLTFDSPSLDPLRRSMTARGILLRGVTVAWGDNSMRDFSQVAVEQAGQYEHKKILIGHSLGALAALSIVDAIPVQHLVLCSPAALFAEDIQAYPDNTIVELIGQKRLSELSDFSAADAIFAVNQRAIPTTVMFGEKERVGHPPIVTRCNLLAAGIVGAELIEVAGAGHALDNDLYASKVAQVVSNIATRLSSTN